MKTPSYPPVRGRLYTFYGLRFPNCVSAIFHFSLFTLHFSLKKKTYLVSPLQGEERGSYYRFPLSLSR